MKLKITLLSLLLTSFAFSQDDNAKDDSQDLEKAIQNPIASLITLPFQNNTDFGIGPDDRTKNVTNIQPVVPLSVSDNTKMIVRTIIPLISQPLPSTNGEKTSEFGLGDIALSIFFTPARPGKLIWGVGPAFGLPTATNSALGSQKWSAGPSVIALIQPKGWTVGGVIQNTWSFAGVSDRADVNFFYSQVFVTKNLPNKWYINSAPIITANWNASSGEQWTLPIGVGFGKLFNIGNRPINGQLGYYNYVVSPTNGPEWQLRAQLNLLFP